MAYDKTKSLTENAIQGVEPNLPTELTLGSAFPMSKELEDRLSEEINDYLANKYGFLHKGFSYTIELKDIDWDTD